MESSTAVSDPVQKSFQVLFGGLAARWADSKEMLTRVIRSQCTDSPTLISSNHGAKQI